MQIIAPLRPGIGNDSLGNPDQVWLEDVRGMAKKRGLCDAVVVDVAMICVPTLLREYGPHIYRDRIQSFRCIESPTFLLVWGRSVGDTAAYDDGKPMKFIKVVPRGQQQRNKQRGRRERR